MISDIYDTHLNEESFSEKIMISLFMDYILYAISSHEVIMSGLV